MTETMFRVRVLAAGQDGQTRLHEDDGVSFAFEGGAYRRTQLRWRDGGRQLLIQPDPQDPGSLAPPTDLPVDLRVVGGPRRRVVYRGQPLRVELRRRGRDGPRPRLQDRPETTMRRVKFAAIRIREDKNGGRLASRGPHPYDASGANRPWGDTQKGPDACDSIPARPRLKGGQTAETS